MGKSANLSDEFNQLNQTVKGMKEHICQLESGVLLSASSIPLKFSVPTVLETDLTYYDFGSA